MRESAVRVVLNETGFKGAQRIEIGLDAINLAFRRCVGGSEERHADQAKREACGKTDPFKFIVYGHNPDSWGARLNSQPESATHADLGAVVAREDFPSPDPVGLADHAFFLHLFDDTGGAVISDLQVALHETGRRLTFAAYEGDGLVV